MNAITYIDLKLIDLSCIRETGPELSSVLKEMNELFGTEKKKLLRVN